MSNDKDKQVSTHYDDRYFEWQSTSGEFGGWADLTKFGDHICIDHDVLDFGCGGGYLLKNIKCRRKLGVEANPAAAQIALANGIEVYQSSNEVPDDCVDVIISNHVLEHTLRPLDELKALYPKLRDGGKIIFVIPCEFISSKYRPNDINNHLYSWGPMCLGNLFAEAGYSIIEVEPYIHKWPPFHRQIARIGGRRVFDAACWITGRLTQAGLISRWFPDLQVRAIAIKPRSRL